MKTSDKLTQDALMGGFFILFAILLLILALC